MSFPALNVPVAAQASAPTEPLPTDLDARLTTIANRAQTANMAFAKLAKTTRELANSANVSEIASDDWAAAQVNIADLGGFVSETSIALAELDQLASNTQISEGAPDSLAAIEALQYNLTVLLDNQLHILTSINATLEQRTMLEQRTGITEQD